MTLHMIVYSTLHIHNTMWRQCTWGSYCVHCGWPYAWASYLHCGLPDTYIGFWHCVLLCIWLGFTSYITSNCTNSMTPFLKFNESKITLSLLLNLRKVWIDKGLVRVFEVDHMIHNIEQKIPLPKNFLGWNAYEAIYA